jgi:cation diffusion facilitator CzcD-associated flavoprotein CzcO
MATEHLDVLIVGAGLSGIGAAWHLQDKCPNKDYAVLEARQAIGGTWDLFRYPGIRSDSDMYTLGYNFKPWTGTKIIADGTSIREYVQETARENGIDKKIRFGVKVVKADWSDDTATWTVTTEQQINGKKKRVNLTCNFLLSCTGYYNYEAGYTPEFTGRDKFKGTIIHPQKWPENLDYSGKKVIVIGSGATAVTLVPAMTDKAAHVTMLQRSPSYVASLPEKDPISEQLRKVMPDMAVYRIGRTRNVALQIAIFRLAKAQPKLLRRALLGLVKRQVGDKVDMKHFKPRYNPWDERLCAVPDGDLFRVLRQGKADIVTDHIERFTEKGILLKSGQELEADIIITATGLDLLMLGGTELSVNGKIVDMHNGMAYKGLMFEGVPNASMVFGYTNASWTLKADLTSEYVCRLINHMDKIGASKCMPINKDMSVKPENFVDMRSGYIQRALSKLPQQGNKAPWKIYMNYALDLPMLRFGKIDDGVMEFSSPEVEASAPSAEAASVA